MTTRFLTSAGFKSDASAQALIRTLDPKDPNLALDAHHQLIWSLFAEEAGADGRRDFLWRQDEGRFQILSARKPKDPHNLLDMSVRSLDLRFEPNERLVFRLRANATVSRGGSKAERRSSRHDVVMDEMRRIESETPHLHRADARDMAIPAAAERWLCRTGDRTGFELEQLHSASYRTLELPRRAGQGAGRSVEQPGIGKRVRGRAARFGVLDLDGTLVVRQGKSFVEALINGFGRGKAFGFGLMLLDRA